MICRPFFGFYGSKYQLAPHYGPPRCDRTVEPFAGSACYSVRWAHLFKHVTLVELDPVISGVWKYMRAVPEREIAALPTPESLVRAGRLGPGEIFSLDHPAVARLPQEARWLIGFWLNDGNCRPGRSMCHWGRGENWRTCWSHDVIYRIITQLRFIRHWTIIEGGYENAPDIEAHWFFDPPYQCQAGRRYRLDFVNYPRLATYILSRRGYIQACEGTGADYLPFEFFREVPSQWRAGEQGVFSAEYLFERDNRG
jgi:hypothetical protein